MVARVKATYAGPGADNYGGKVYPGQLSLIDQIANFAATTMGTSPAAGRQAQAQEIGGVMVLGPTYGPGQLGQNGKYVFDARLTPFFTALYDFSDPNSFPLAYSATPTAQALATTEVFSDLSTYAYGSQANGGNKALPYPNATAQASAVALNYVVSDPNGYGRPGIVLDTAGQALSFSPATNTSATKPYATAQTSDCMWTVAFDTPAALAASATEMAIFTIGQSMAALQFALTVLNGNLNCYVNGAVAATAIANLAVTSRYVVSVHFMARDPNNPFNYLVEIFVNGSPIATVSNPWPPVLTPWTFTNGTNPRKIVQGDGTCQFGPSAAFGSGVWNFIALGYAFEDFTSYSAFSDTIAGVSLDNGDPDTLLNHVAALSTSFGSP